MARRPGFPTGSARFSHWSGRTPFRAPSAIRIYGGNANFVGWDLIGYPGVRTIVTPDEQRLGADVPANHKSAYDYEMFTKASAERVACADARSEPKRWRLG